MSWQEIRLDDIFLLCSDGLNKEIANTEIESILQTTSIIEATDQGGQGKDPQDGVQVFLAAFFTTLPGYSANGYMPPDHVEVQHIAA